MHNNIKSVSVVFLKRQAILHSVKMKFFATVFCAAVAFTAADVSHLQNKYLPPQHHYHETASHTNENLESGPSSFGHNSQFGNERFPSASSSFELDARYFVRKGAASLTSFESSEYGAPAVGSITADASYSGPETADSFSSFETTEYNAPILDSIQTDTNYFAPDSAASISSLKTAHPQTSDLTSSLPSFEAPQSTSFSAGDSSRSSPSVSNSLSYLAPAASVSEIDTQYAADGGYVY